MTIQHRSELELLLDNYEKTSNEDVLAELRDVVNNLCNTQDNTKKTITHDYALLLIQLLEYRSYHNCNILHLNKFK